MTPEQEKQLLGVYDIADVPNMHGGSFVSGLFDSIKKGFTLPGDVYAGKTNPLSDEAVERAFELTGTLSGQAPLTAQAGSAGVFGGMLSRKGDWKGLADAQRLYKDGHLMEDDIWLTTGWGKGADNKWRYEIPDEKAELSGWVKSGSQPLYELFNHDELYKAYPGIENITVLNRSKPGEGFYDKNMHGDEFISVNKGDYTRDPEGLRSVLLHELQHAVQQREGFAKGANPDWALGEAVRRAVAPAAKGDQHYRDLLSKFSELPDGAKDQLAQSLYHAFGGEVEARNVQYRSRFDKDARLVPPDVTEDLDRSLHILYGIRE